MNARIMLITKKLVDAYHEMDRIGKLILIYAGLHTFAAALASIGDVFGVIASIASAAMVWIMYWKLAKEYGLSPMENKGMLLKKAILSNVISAGAGLILMLVTLAFGLEESWFVEAAINFVGAFLSGKVFCRMLSKAESKDSKAF